jgi:gas vesicle protein
MKYDRDSLILGSSTLLAGMLLGMAVGMLLTPYSGARMRRRLRFLSEDWLESIIENLDEVVVRGQRVIASGFQKLAI